MNTWQKDAVKTSDTTRLVWVIVIAFCALVLSMIVALAGEKYQTYNVGFCEWCKTKGDFLNPLQQAHFYNQAKHPLWKNVRLNSKTLHRRCHIVFHKGNWKNEVPEWCVLFGLTTNQIIEACIKETGSIDGKGLGK